ncbi:Fe-S cluster assembly ATPase SufC [Candidatus Woesearchaeota archaeon]|nr:Fe-S cluster assembly ATPase SufC [Candidatus Woesearchaeota archaeon]
MADLEIKNLHVTVNGVEILKGINLEINKGEIIALMGPNGSGKSTIANVLMGNPEYKIEKGKIIFKNQDITEMSPSERAKLGLFLSFQYPSEISGVSVANFLRTALNARRKEKISVLEFKKLLEEKMKLLNMKESLVGRYLNEGFSGGEKKRNEILQMAVLEPELAILDETDSGTDVDALKVISNGINTIKSKTNMGVLLITHYNRILQYVKPDRVVVIIDGKIAKEGLSKLADEIEVDGYKEYGEIMHKITQNLVQ